MRHIVSRGIEVTIIVQGMAYSMGSVVLQAATEGRRLAFPHRDRSQGHLWLLSLGTSNHVIFTFWAPSPADASSTIK